MNWLDSLLTVCVDVIVLMVLAVSGMSIGLIVTPVVRPVYTDLSSGSRNGSGEALGDERMSSAEASGSGRVGAWGVSTRASRPGCFPLP